MSFFDQAYDEMSWDEVCYRLPSDLAIRALERRITNLDTLSMFLDSVKTQKMSVSALKGHVNKILLDYTPEEILETFDQSKHPILFRWTDDKNRDRLKNEGRDKLTYKFLYNLSSSEDIDTLNEVMDQILDKPAPEPSEVVSVLNKVSVKHFIPFLTRVLKDPRPEVKSVVLNVSDSNNARLISKHQKVIALKALLQTNKSDRFFSVDDFEVFCELKPLERLRALKSYLQRFPKYKQLKVFNPMPSQDELDLVLFAGCIEHNDLVNEISKMYREVTQELPPKDKEDET